MKIVCSIIVPYLLGLFLYAVIVPYLLGLFLYVVIVQYLLGLFFYAVIVPYLLGLFLLAVYIDTVQHYEGVLLCVSMKRVSSLLQLIKGIYVRPGFN